ncbi:MAG TPA: hypothetical protein DCZ94_11930 [Lentisphaeria bacterium]|nr:MAG: hypothetical protein A2X48_09470 [Lentisphaerae bacterium GWF2_49_21]HBC87657.1 hypothetical protein [Lentisphaeria bacterium]
MSGWDRSGAIVMADDIEKPRYVVRVTSMYDQSSLYLAFEFKDPTPMVNHVDPKKSPGQAWCGDTVQLRFNTSPDLADKPQKPEQLLHLDGYWYTDGKQAVAYAVYGDLAPGGKVEKTIEQAIGQGVEMSFRPDADGKGYLQIIRIDWKMLRPDGEAYKAGQSLRMAIEAMWGNIQYQQHAADRVVDLLNPKHMEKEMLWTNPPAFGKVDLVDKGGLEPGETSVLWPKLVERYEQLQKEEAARTVPQTAEKATPPAPDRPCLDGKDEVQRLLNQWFAEGTAAGNKGDCYDNRDREHSAIKRSQFPQLRNFEYTKEQTAKNEDYALFLGVRSDVTFGNSSTSSAPEKGGCNPRHAMMQPMGMSKLCTQYRGSNLYMYPAHHDYLPGHNGQGMYGDLLPLNSPYVLISKGSSGSDIPFLNAMIHTAAAFDPKVKEILVKHGLLMPTLQAIMRASNTQVVKPEDYFTGKAHPIVFRGDQLNELKMVKAAHAMTPEQILPLAMVRVVDEDMMKPGVNAPEGMPSERFCETPAVVGRIFRRWDRAMRMKVSAAESFDYMNRPLQFRWVLLQGNLELVRIEPSKDGSEALLTIAWHDRFPVEAGSSIDTNRVDIGVFASTGEGWSAPAFISVCCPDNELRTYDEKNRLVDIHYSAGDTRIGYETDVLLPGEGIAPYHVRDWPALLEMVDGKGEGMVREMLQKSLKDDARTASASVRQELLELVKKFEAQREAKPASNLNARRDAVRRDAKASSQPLLKTVPSQGRSVKDMLEAVLNGWKDDPMFYLRQREAIDAEAVKIGSKAKDELEKARKRLVELGIYQMTAGGGWELHSVRPGDKPVLERLTKYERLELQRFHLEILNHVLLPGVLVRDYTFNYVDNRMAVSPPLWLVFDYDEATRKVNVNVRKTDEARAPQPLENP